MDVAVSADTDATGAEVPRIESERPAAVPYDDPLVEEELLVEEVSIDGMCGVY